MLVNLLLIFKRIDNFPPGKPLRDLLALELARINYGQRLCKIIGPFFQNYFFRRPFLSTAP